MHIFDRCESEFFIQREPHEMVLEICKWSAFSPIHL